MAQFIKLAITEYDEESAPSIGADDQWINIDHIVRIEEQMGNNLFRRHGLRDQIKPEHYPCLMLHMSDGQQHLVSLGNYPDGESGMRAIEQFLPTITGAVPVSGVDERIGARSSGIYDGK